MTFTFVVRGIPQPQGSARAFTYTRRPEKGGGIGARVDSDNPKLKGWRRDVGLAARATYRGDPVLGPVTVAARFYLKRPLSLKLSKPHITRPDVDKLGRGIADAMTGILYADDGQIVRFDVSKAYAGIGESPRAEISVSEVGQLSLGKVG